MKMKNRKGSTLILTLLIFVVLIILGTFILNFMMNENRASLRYQRKVQAYYVARSGVTSVESAILKMNEVELKKLNEELDKGIVQVDEIIVGEGKANVVLDKDGDNLIIESRGKIGKVEDAIIKIMIGEQSTSEINIEHAIFSLEKINLSNGLIKGDIGTNDSIDITGNPTLEGNAYLLNENNFSTPDWWKNKWINYSIKKLENKRTYELIKFPQYPINNSTVDFIQGGSDKTTIKENKDYNKFEVNSNTIVYIDTTKNDIVLNIKNFHLNNGHIVVLGSNKLTFYVGEMIIGAGSSINYFNLAGNPSQISIYHNGTSALNISGNVKIAGNLYIEKAKLNMSGSGSILGNVLSNGSSISLAGNSDITKGLIYAPNANISFSGSGKAYGAIIGKIVDLTGGGEVIFDPQNIDTSLIDSISDSTLKFRSGYFK
ncbi:DUF2807 domain-containing protein [Tissierella sp. MSJ-40]|uniref:DUF2807 domain-containing protein n=1 Tax=Tissierella simiarum TaxID=2841534 RepID=A0ABS6E3L9_9FIRM|nr:DUF2807 domain-containing protein [Tissierella simiarum]MBU5437508.1 DUF2807 domain-containing protein [Tissierella simiarum]